MEQTTTYTNELIVTALIRKIFVMNHNRLDSILASWYPLPNDTMTVKTEFAEFMRIITAKINIRIHSQCIYFTEDERSKISIHNMSNDEQVLFMNMINPKRVAEFFKTIEAPSNLICMNAGPTYDKFLLNDFVETIFPRDLICGRFIALRLYGIRSREDIVELYMVLKMAVTEYQCGDKTESVMRIAYELLNTYSVPIISTNTWHPKRSMFPQQLMNQINNT